MLLALDTSTSLASVALVQSRRVVVELTWEVGQRHSTELLQRLYWLLDTHGVAAHELTAVAVATGPGSFNGVRVALTTAKSLAFAGGIPLYGHPTLDVIAWGSADADGQLCAVLEAGRGQLYCARYSAPTASAAGWGPRDGYHIQTPAEIAEVSELAEVPEVAACSRERVLFCGEWREETQARLMEALGERARFRSQVAPRRASWLAELALARIESDAPADDPVQLEPLYLRRPAITTSTKPILRRSDTVSAGSAPEERSGEGASRALHG